MQRLVDQFQRYVRAAHPVYYRFKRFPDAQQTQAVSMGFAISPSGTLMGTQDVLVQPPPQYVMISLHNIGMSQGKLRFGARKFIISQTFVSAMMVELGVTQDAVWKGQQFVGLVTDGQLFSVEDIAHQELSGNTIVWELTCNSNEVR